MLQEIIEDMKQLDESRLARIGRIVNRILDAYSDEIRPGVLE